MISAEFDTEFFTGAALLYWGACLGPEPLLCDGISGAQALRGCSSR